MHVVYFATRDEDGTIRQTITRARWIDAWVGEKGPVLNMMLPSGTQQTAYVEALRVQTEEVKI